MYGIDANIFMNAVVLAILAAFVALLAAAVGVTAYRGRGAGPSRAVSYLYMFTGLFGAFAVVVAVLGFRGQTSGARPWHVFLDMKYQGKYKAQSQSKFFADGRSSRLPVEGTVPFDGADYFTDAGRHDGPSPDFLKADSRYYAGVADPDAKTVDKDGVTAFNPPTWDGTTVKDGYYVARIPEEAVTRAGGWDQLLKHGQRAYAVNCAVCHGASGRGGGGPGDAGNQAYGVTGAYGMANIASYHQDRLRETPDGDIFNTITNGKNSMSAYGHNIKVQDRWAIVAHVRTLQYAQAGRK